MAALERRRLALEAEMATATAPAPRLHPNLAETYRRKVADLVAALQQEDGAEVREIVRGLVECVTLHPEGDRQRVEVRGELAAILQLAQGAERARRAGGGGSASVLAEQVKLVAGARCHLYRTRFVTYLRRPPGRPANLICCSSADAYFLANRV